MNKGDVSLLVGAMVDKFDTALYGFLTPIIAPLFFPHHDYITQLILGYATSCVLVVVRPLGTFLFGMFACDYGPQLSLWYCLLGMAVGVILVGCTPDYAAVGWYAPLFLIGARCVKCFFAAGESSVAKLYVIHNKTTHHALRASAWYNTSAIVGVVSASACATIVMNLGGQSWRVCFVTAGFMGLIALWGRSFVLKSALQKRVFLTQECVNNGLQLLWTHKKNVVRVACVSAFSYITYALPFVFMNSFVPLITDIPLHTMMATNMWLLLCDGIAVIVVGYWTARYSHMRIIMLLSSSVLMITIVPLFYYLPHAPLWYVMSVRMWIVVWGVIFLSPLSVWCNAIFHNEQEKYFLVGMASAFGNGVVGSTTIPVCLWLWHVSGFAYMPAVFLACLIGVVFVVILTEREH